MEWSTKVKNSTDAFYAIEQIIILLNRKSSSLVSSLENSEKTLIDSSENLKKLIDVWKDNYEKIYSIADHADMDNPIRMEISDLNNYIYNISSTIDNINNSFLISKDNPFERASRIAKNGFDSFNNEIKNDIVPSLDELTKLSKRLFLSDRRMFRFHDSWPVFLLSVGAIVALIFDIISKLPAFLQI